MHEFLLDIWQQYRMTIIFVTHDIEQSVLLADRVTLMGGKPPTIQDVIDIPLPRPRDAGDVGTEAFLPQAPDPRGTRAVSPQHRAAEAVAAWPLRGAGGSEVATKSVGLVDYTGDPLPRLGT
jgi:NitT/TauT family transport system ATP-binding protein